MSFNSRGTGKTTARVLQSIADALLHPDQPVSVIPDDLSKLDCDLRQLNRFAESISSTCKLLGITLDVNVSMHAVVITSPITRMREEHHRKCDPTSCDTDEKSSAVRDAEAAVATSSPDLKDYLKDFGLRTSEGHKSFCEALEQLSAKRGYDSFLDGFGRPVREVFPGRVLPKGTEIVQQQPAAEASKPEASIPNAQSDADKDFIHKLNSNRTLRELCDVVDSHMAKELGFPNVREYRDAVRASIMSFKTPPEQPEAQHQSKISEISFPPEFKLMLQRWPEAVMRWNMKMNRHESRLFSVTTDRDHKCLAIVVKYPGKVSPEWVTECDGKELALHGVTAFA